MANVQGRVDLNTIKALAKANNGRYRRIDNVFEGKEGTYLVFAWDDEDESDAFIELLESLLGSGSCDAVNDGDVEPLRILGCSHDHEGGILTSYVSVSRDVQ